ncbi:iron uptake system component EfeO [Geodermatophilus tzadiensis]|uniref:Iron uptake system component EfeO n=1 Tax=Geodermatophilus tzadiensis TaxID=1137988 RepID=A0A2T0STD0_9ACTN|nr:iron uptake system protein EfeO [Geodermatophilus tzadiensis]PRY36623.1 iron uptake system component EfeO [Geodermatophilus tzadiensis]
MRRSAVLLSASLLTLPGCAGSVDGAGPAGSSASDGSSAATVSPEVATAVDAGVVSYREYVLEQARQTREASAVFTDAVRAGELEAARAAYAPSRVGWERIEPVAGLVEELDGKLDARVDDFEGVEDPDFTGWHRLEFLLFERGTTEGGAPLADQLDADLATLERELAEVDITALDVATGATELVEEVSRGKITGEEDRYAHTDLWDFAANIEGAVAAVERLRPALEAQDPQLLADVEAGLAEVQAGLGPYALPEGGYASYETLTEQDRRRLSAQLAALAEDLSRVPGALGLE